CMRASAGNASASFPTTRCTPTADPARRPTSTRMWGRHEHRALPLRPGRGLGRTLMQELIAAARQREVHAMIGGIDATNAASIALHEQLGFRHSGTLPQVGFKFCRWLDLAFYQLLLDTPSHPVDR